MDRSHNITVKSENGQFYIIRNLTPEVIKPKTEPRSSAPVVLPTPPIFTMARSHDEEKRRRVYTPLMTVPPLFRWEFQWDFCVANWSWALVEPWTTNFSWIVAKFHIFWDVRRVQRLVLISWGFELCLHFVTQEHSRWMLQVERQHTFLSFQFKCKNELHHTSSKFSKDDLSRSKSSLSPSPSELKREKHPLSLTRQSEWMVKSL